MKYTVILDVRAHGSSYTTTEDIIEATTPQAAEQQAIRAWRAVRPDRTFHPLLTLRAGRN